MTLENKVCIMDFNKEIIQEGLNQALVIAKKRANMLENLKQALIEDDLDKIKHHAKILCGLNNESSRISKSLNTRTEQ